VLLIFKVAQEFMRRVFILRFQYRVTGFPVIFNCCRDQVKMAVEFDVTSIFHQDQEISQFPINEEIEILFSSFSFFQLREKFQEKVGFQVMLILLSSR